MDNDYLNRIKFYKKLKTDPNNLVTEYEIVEVKNNFIIVKMNSIYFCFIPLNSKNLCCREPIKLSGHYTILDKFIMDTCHLWDDTGRLIIDAKTFIYRLCSSLIISEVDGKKGAINLKGEIVIPHLYLHIQALSDQLIGVYSGETYSRKKIKYGLYDITGKELLECKYKDFYFIDENKVIVVENNNHYLVNLDLRNNNHSFKQLSIPGKIYEEFNNGICILQRRKKYQLMDYMGNILTDNKYTSLRVFTKGYYLGQRNYKSFLLNSHGKEIYKFPESGAEVEGNNVFANAGKYYRIENDNVMPFSELDIAWLDDFRDGIAYFYDSNDNYGLIDQYGKVVFQYDEKVFNVRYIEKGLWFFSKDAYQGFICDRNGKVLLEDVCHFNVISKKGNLVSYSCRDDNDIIMHGLVDISGNELIKPHICKPIHIVNEELIIYNNHFLNIKDIEEVYKVNININNTCVNKTFDTQEKQDLFVQLFTEGIEEELNNYSKDIENKVYKKLKRGDNSAD